MKRMNKCFAALLCLVCLTAGAALGLAEGTNGETTATYSTIYDYAVVEGTDKLNMRIGPNANNDLVGAAFLGEWVGILGEQENWVYAYIPALNQYGYMASNYLRMNAETGVPGEGVIHNPQAGAKTGLYSFPAYQFQTVKTFENGVPFSLISASVDGWYEVEIDGEKGYLRCETVKLTKAQGAEMAVLQAPDNGTVLMRNRPYFLGAQIIGEFSTGAQAGVLVKSAKKDAFWKVVVNGQVGYVPGQCVRLDGEEQTQYADLETTNATEQNQTPLNLRMEPSNKARVIARCDGEELKIIASGEVWTKVYDAEKDCVGFCRTDAIGVSPALTIRKVSADGAYLCLNLINEEAAKSGIGVPKGADVTVLIPGGEWCRVRFAGTVGYMKAEWLE